MEIVPAVPTWASLVETEPGIGHLIDLAAKVTPADRPRPAAFIFFRKAAEKLVGPAARSPELRDPAALELVVRELATILGVNNFGAP